MENIKENNALIAKFMGYSQEQRKPFKGTTYWWKEGDAIPKAYLTYNFDWNALIEVVEKIETVLPEDDIIHISYKDCVIPLSEDGEEIWATGSQKIEAVYNAVCQFIEWYNSKQK